MVLRLPNLLTNIWLDSNNNYSYCLFPSCLPFKCSSYSALTLTLKKAQTNIGFDQSLIIVMALQKFLVAFAIVFVLFSCVNALSSNYYDKTCPDAESTITQVVRKAMWNDKTVPAALLRMHFHDCFVRVKLLILLYINRCVSYVYWYCKVLHDRRNLY